MALRRGSCGVCFGFGFVKQQMNWSSWTVSNSLESCLRDIERPGTVFSFSDFWGLTVHFKSEKSRIYHDHNNSFLTSSMLFCISPNPLVSIGIVPF